jgi:hypothetical protein
MRDRQHIDQDARSLRRASERSRNHPSAALSLIDLQRTAGNAAVVDLLAQRGGPTVQRDGGHPTAAPAAATDLDEKAQAIIDAAAADHPAASERAVNAVQQIVDTYYGDKASTVSGITYKASEPGLKTTSQGKGDSSTGSIAVGDYFLNNTTKAGFARRVLQVGHELEHIQQYRSGMGGETHRHEREFLAFYHEGTAAAVPHTGKMAHANRVNLLDEAIRHYNAFSDADKKRYADQYKDLLEQRAKELKASGNDKTDPPTEAAP